MKISSDKLYKNRGGDIVKIAKETGGLMYAYIMKPKSYKASVLTQSAEIYNERQWHYNFWKETGSVSVNAPSELEDSTKDDFDLIAELDKSKYPEYFL